MPCPLCDAPSEHVLWQDERCRVIRIEDDDYGGFCRVVWQQHVAEMSDLATPDRQHLMHVVFATESALRELMQPEKINLASLGNLVPHLHWHVIARFPDDRHFPQPVWGQPQRQTTRREGPDNATLAVAIQRHLSL